MAETNYITIVKGDDTNFVDDQFIIIKFNTNIDFTGFVAKFTLGDTTLTYNEIKNKEINVVLNNSFTSNLKKGKQMGELKLIDSNSRIRTITSVIPFLVIDSVKTSPTYINNVLEFVTEINTTTIDITIETAGIARSEAEEYIAQMEGFKISTEQSSMSASANAQQTLLSEENAKGYAEVAQTAQDNASSSATLAQTASEDALEYRNEAKEFAEKAAEKVGQSDWNEVSEVSKNFIKNKPTKLSDFEDDITVQADYEQTDNTQKDYIKNSPRVKTWNVTVSTSWVGTTNPYTQEILLAGMLSSDNVLIALKSSSATAIKEEQKELSKIFFAETLEGKLKLYAKSPTKSEISLLVYESEKE